MLTQVPITVADVAQLLAAGFTHIEIWKSEDLGNSYQPITKSVAGPPVLRSIPASNTYLMGGRSVVLDFSGTHVTFGPFPTTFLRWTAGQVVDFMNEVRVGCATVEGESVKVTGTGAGRGQYLLVLHAPEGFLTAGDEARGDDAFIPLVTDQPLYTYQDLGPSAALHRYRWRFSANGLAPYSELSGYQKAQAVPLDLALVSIGFARFVGLDGAPAKGRIIIVNDSPAKVGLLTISSDPLVLEADDVGFLQVRLLRGAQIKVAIEGTSIVRSLTVPDVASFDILTAVAAAPDAFTPATTAPLLTRRSI